VSIKLIGEIAEFGYNTYVFAYDDRNINGHRVGFVYQKGPDREIRDGDHLIGSIQNHAPHFFMEEPTTVFTQEELDRILTLPVYRPKRS